MQPNTRKTMASFGLPLIFRPYIVRELPGWGRLIDALGIGGIDNVNKAWRNAPIVRAKGKSHGYLMELNLKDDNERVTYFVGRYYDLPIQLILDRLLKPGDTFIDVGANIGMTTLHAASRVGAQGKVIAFEPQPRCCDKIVRHIEINDIRHITVHNVGLAERQSEMTLRIPPGGTIMAFIAENNPTPNAGEEIRIPIRRGDDLVRGQITGDLMIKIDVEGYEFHVLQGLAETIERQMPAIITEVVPRHLRRAGADQKQLFDYLHSFGYRGHTISLRRERFKSPVIHLSEINRIEVEEADVLWLHHGCNAEL